MPIEKRGWKLIPIPTDVVLSEILSDFDVRVYGYLLWRAGQKDRAWPGLPRIAKDLRHSESAVKYALKRLQEENWIKRLRRFGHSSVTYIFERQEDCISFVDKRSVENPDSSLEVVRSAKKLAIRTDVSSRSAKKLAVDQPKNWLSISQKTGQQNDHSVNDHSSNMNEWMNDDPVCKFLRTLPGYNPGNIEADRRGIVSKSYSIEALGYLWADAQNLAADNPIGLFLAMTANGQQSADFLAVLEQRRLAAQQPARRRNGNSNGDVEAGPPLAPPVDTRPVIVVKSWPKAAEWWEAAKGELMLEMNKATFDTWVRPTLVVDVERDVFAGKDGQGGVYVIGCPNEYSRDWLSKHLASTVNRILTGIHGAPWTARFVTGRFVEEQLK